MKNWPVVFLAKLPQTLIHFVTVAYQSLVN